MLCLRFWGTQLHVVTAVRVQVKYLFCWVYMFYKRIFLEVIICSVPELNPLFALITVRAELKDMRDLKLIERNCVISVL